MTAPRNGGGEGLDMTESIGGGKDNSSVNMARLNWATLKRNKPPTKRGCQARVGDRYSKVSGLL